MQTEMSDKVQGFLITETGASTRDEMTRLNAAIRRSSELYPNYFVECPKTLMENLRREVFILSAKISYFEFYANYRYLNRLKQDLHDRCVRLAMLQQDPVVEKGN
jgi:hypothetical protein